MYGIGPAMNSTAAASLDGKPGISGMRGLDPIWPECTVAVLHDYGQNGVKYQTAHTKILPSNAIIYGKINWSR